jgi:shikimate kinase
MKSPQDNIILVGFMGTGKSSLGRLVAKLTGRRFVDTDHLIVQREGREIGQIFREHGEPHFREIESCILASLAPGSGLVVATGGGIVTTPKNLSLLKTLGLVVWLQASEEEIFRRVSRNSKRPLLQTENPRKTIFELLAKRAPLYEAASHVSLNTTLLSHKEAAEALISRASQGIPAESEA